MNVKTSSKNQKQQIWAKAISPWRATSELKGEQLQRAPGHFATEMAMARNFARRNTGELNGEEFQKVGRSGQENFAMASKILPGEVRRFHLSLVTWQKPTGEGSSSRHGETNSARRNITFSDSYKSSIVLISDIILSYLRERIGRKYSVFIGQ
jgi:hypothetical protein